MIIKRKGRDVPELNTTSTADISFILLILFLVCSSMDIDKGLSRQLPLPSTPEQQEQVAQVEKDKLMSLRLTASDELFVNDEPLKTNQLTARLVEFIIRIGNDHLITVDVDRDASYEAYFQLQNKIVAAYRLVRRKYHDMPMRIAEVYNSKYGQASVDGTEGGEP